MHTYMYLYCCLFNVLITLLSCTLACDTNSPLSLSPFGPPQENKEIKERQEKEMQERKAEEERLRREAKEREEEKRRREIAELKRKQRDDRIESLKKTAVGVRALDRITVEVHLYIYIIKSGTLYVERFFYVHVHVQYIHVLCSLSSHSSVALGAG